MAEVAHGGAGAGAAAATGDELDALRAAVTKQAGVVKSLKAEGKPQVRLLQGGSVCLQSALVCTRLAASRCIASDKS